jgi:hypothetical protein
VTNWNFEEVNLSGFFTNTTTAGLFAFVWTVLNRVFVPGLVYLKPPSSLATVLLRVPRPALQGLPAVLQVLPTVLLALVSPTLLVLKAPMDFPRPVDTLTALLELLPREDSHRVLRALSLAPRAL